MSNKKYIRKPEVMDLRLKRLYGITLEEYKARMLKQDSRCAICGGVNKSGKQLAVDHHHITGKVRGLLCSNCNNGLGLFQDNPELLNKAAAYIKYQ